MKSDDGDDDDDDDDDLLFHVVSMEVGDLMVLHFI